MRTKKNFRSFTISFRWTQFRCCCINRSFKKIFYNPALYIEIDFSEFQQKVTDEVVGYFKSRLKLTRYVNLKGCKLITMNSITILEENCHSLKCLDIRGTILPPGATQIFNKIKSKSNPDFSILQETFEIDQLFADIHSDLAGIMLIFNSSQSTNLSIRSQLASHVRQLAIHINQVSIQSKKLLQKNANELELHFKTMVRTMNEVILLLKEFLTTLKRNSLPKALLKLEANIEEIHQICVEIESNDVSKKW